MSKYISEQSVNFSSVVELLRWKALKQPQQKAYSFLLNGEEKEISLTYEELDAQARAIAALLQSKKFTGERAILLYPPGLDFITAFFGCLYAGVIAVPAYPPRPNRSMSLIQGIVVDAQAKVALTTTSIFSELEQRFTQMPELKHLNWLKTNQLSQELGRSWQAPVVESDSLAYLQYTSGSTSTPKGVMVSHGNVLYNSQCIKQAFALTPNSVSVSWLPHFHDMGLIDGIIQPLYTGFLGVLMPPMSFVQQPIRWLQAISRYRATHCGGPNFAYKLCVDKITPEQRETLNLSSWCTAYNGSELIRQQTLEQFIYAFQSCGFRAKFFYPCYGLAENTLMVSGGLVDDEPICHQFQADLLEQNQVFEAGGNVTKNVKQLVGCGRSWLDTKIVIVNPETLRQCAPNQVGEIWVSGSSVTQGYWQRPEETERTFRAYIADTGDGPFLRTGDLGFLQNGELFVTGRLKELVIIRGRNYYPQDIEMTVEQSHPALRSGYCAAFALEENGAERLVVAQEVERSYLRKLNVEVVARAIRQAVAQQHELQVYGILLLKPGSIPNTSSGKIQRYVCRSEFLANHLDEVARSFLTDSNEVGSTVALTREDLLLMTPKARHLRLMDYLQEQVLRVAKAASSQIGLQQPLSQLGLDSLMAVELKHQIEADLGVMVSVVDFFQEVSFAQLATQILEQLENSSFEPCLNLAPVREKVTEFSLSYGQRAMWFLYQLAPKSAAYNVFFAMRILSDLDVVALKQAFQILSDRHPALRTTYTTKNGQALQQIRAHLEVAFEEANASTWSLEDLNARLLELSHRPLNLEEGPIMRVGLFRRGVKEHILLVVIHHIAIDLWSLVVFMDELRILYPALESVGSVSLPPLDLQYTDFVRWQAEMLTSVQGERQWNYWQQQLAGELPVLKLPTDRPRPPIQTYKGAAEISKLDQELTGKLKAIAQAEKATLYMILLAAFQVLLYRYTAQEDILVGSPAAGRSRSEFAKMVGYLDNPVVLRANLSGNPKFRDFLNQVRYTVLGAIEHQDYPFSLLVERLQPERDSSYSPLFQVMFVLEKPHQLEELSPFVLGEAGTQMNLGGLQLEPFPIEQQFAQFDVKLMMVEVEGGLSASWQYNTDLFDATTITRMMGHFRTLLEAIVVDPARQISQLPLLTTGEQHQLLLDWNNTQTEYPQAKCLHQLFQAQVERTPNAVAVVLENQQLTYQELNWQANQLAHHLQKLGVGPETLVGIYVERSLEMVVGLLSVLKAGGAYVPLDPSYPQDRLKFMLSDSQVSVLLTQSQFASELCEQKVSIICLDTDWEDITQANSQENPISGVHPENVAYVIYTSGSTGKPKGTMNTHLGVCNRLLWMQQTYQLTPADCVLQKTPFSFDVSVWEFFWPLLVGARLVMAKPGGHQDVAYLIKQIVEQKITTLHFVPSMLRVFLEEHNAEACSCLKHVFCSGEALTFELQERFFKCLPAVELHNLYGPTEASIDVTYWQCVSPATAKPKQQSHTRTVPIGHPIANTQIYILDRHLQPVPVGVPGELHIGGVGLARGYLNRPDLTNAKFILNPFSSELGARLYKTGDVARYLPDGNIEFLGRLDNQVKIRGCRIELGEIETVLSQHPDIKETVVIPREDQPGEQRLVAYIIPQHLETVPTPSELRDFLQKELPDYMVPSAFVTLDALPLKSNGKVDFQALPAPKGLRPELKATYVMPETEAEQLIANIWQEVLRLDKVGIYDNFFDLGGHSLLVVQVHNKLSQIFGQDLSVVEMFRYTNIHSLAKYLSLNQSEKTASNQSHERVETRSARKATMRQTMQLRQRSRSTNK